MQLPPLQDIIERLGALLRSETRLAEPEHRLQPVHLSALAYLNDCNRFSDTPQSVTEYLGLTKGTVSQSLRALEHNGLISKQADAQDGRVVHLRLSRKGKKALTALRPSPLLSKAAEQLSATEQAQLSKLLAKFVGAALQNTNQKAFGLCHGCRFHRQGNDGENAHCTLMGIPLRKTDINKRCREFEAPPT